MELLIAITVTVLSIHLPTLLSIGADVALVTSTGALHGRRQALLAAAGITTGSGVMVGLALLLHETVMHISPGALYYMRLVGAGYLILLAILTLRPANKKTAPNRRNRLPFLTGLLTEITNPKTILFFVTVFSLVGRQTASLALHLYAGFLITVLTGVYYSILAVGSSHTAITRLLSKHAFLIRVITAGIFLSAAALLVIV